MQVTYKKSALKSLMGMQPKRAQSIQAAINEYAANPDMKNNNVTALVGIIGGVRIRIGDWRVSMIVTTDAIDVFEIQPRGSAYK